MSLNPLADNYFSLSGEVALVTGASSGLGRGFAEVLAAAGCRVAVAARRIERLRVLADSIDATGGRALPLAMDVTDARSVQAGLDALEASFGGPASILVNNAGMVIPSNFLDAPAEDTEQVFALNQTAVWRVAQEVCQRLRHVGQPGSIINIASIAGLGSVGGIASYAVSKAAVVQLTRIMALELARYRIRVNAIAPGYFATELNRDYLASADGQRLLSRSPMRRAGNPGELDGLLLLLASVRSSFMTGAVIPVDGGHLLANL